MAKFARAYIKRLLIAEALFGTVVLVVGILEAILSLSPVVVLPIVVFIFHIVLCIVGKRAVNKRQKMWANISFGIAAFCFILCIVLIVVGFALAGLNGVCNKDTDYCKEKTVTERFQYEMHFTLLFLLGFLGLVGTALSIWLLSKMWMNRFYLQSEEYTAPETPRTRSIASSKPDITHTLEDSHAPRDISYDGSHPYHAPSRGYASAAYDTSREPSYDRNHPSISYSQGPPSSQGSYGQRTPVQYDPHHGSVSYSQGPPSREGSYGQRTPVQYDPHPPARPQATSRGSSGSRGEFSDMSRSYSNSVDI